MNSFNDERQLNLKESITKLADEARIQISQNKYLLEIINIFKQQVIIVKNLITNYSLNSNQQNNLHNLATKYKEQLFALNKKLKEEINKNKKKQENILNNLSEDLFEVNQTLSQFSIDNFILNNTICKLDSKITTLYEGIDSSKKYDIFREPKRESDIEIRNSKTVFQSYNLEVQQKMLSLARALSNYKLKNVKKESKIKDYKNKIKILKYFIRYYCKKLYGDENKILDEIKKNNEIINKDKKDNFLVDIKKRIKTNPLKNKILPKINKSKKYKEKNEINENYEDNIYNEENENESNGQENESKNINNDKTNNNNNNDTTLNKTFFINENDTSLFKNIYNEEKKEKEKEKEKENKDNNIIKTERKKINILKIDELLDIENIEVKDEEIIDDELNSDDETFFEKKVKPKKKISTDFLSDIKKEIPPINLSQIEFNKLKIINDADAYSLQRRNFEQSNINGKIKNMKNKNKNLTKKISMNKKKLEVIHNFIEDVKYNYKLLRPIKVQTSAAGNPVHYIREKLLNIVEETINESEIKEKKFNDNNNIKNNIENKKIGENIENEGDIVGSDYSDEDEYIKKYTKKDFSSDNKENIDINKVTNGNLNTNIKKNNNKKNEIKTNLIPIFESNNEKEENKKKNKINNNYKDDLLENIIVQSK